MRTTVSFASEPELPKNTIFMCSGVISASFSASAIAGGWVVLKNVL